MEHRGIRPFSIVLPRRYSLLERPDPFLFVDPLHSIFSFLLEKAMPVLKR